ncbi:hypothetical protein Elgi_38250 [Paenibacillus elgii]|uniref:hypothetical protein n=1 Tax=Paenibacillus elgii TaxID=189691 RepID=UPI002D7CC3F1|nr:hypothetical protein Elgi_38250 [Paenibacillus elgii]
MKLNELLIGQIENALNVKLTGDQKGYLLTNEVYCWSGGRSSGKTFAHCIKLALSEGEPLDMSNPEKFSDYGDGTRRYARDYYRRMFMYIWYQLQDYGFPVREVKK